MLILFIVPFCTSDSDSALSLLCSLKEGLSTSTYHTLATYATAVTMVTATITTLLNSVYC